MAAEVISIPRRPRVDFDDHTAGPALTAALDDVDMTALIGQDVAAGARAGFRARNHADWQRLTYLREMCRAHAGTTDRDDEPDPAVAAAAFGWSMSMATAQLGLAVGSLERLPDLGEAMCDGRLEERKAAVFVTVLADLDDDQACVVTAGVLPEASGLPVHALTQRVTKAAIAIDPMWAARRYAAARRRARIQTSTAPAGTAHLAVRDADPDRVQDGYLHVQTLARAVRSRLRAAGRPARLGYIAAHVLLRLLDGSLLGVDDEDVIEAVTTELAEDPDTPDDGDITAPDGPGGDSDDGGPDDGGPDDDSGPDDSGPDGAPEPASEPEPTPRARMLPLLHGVTVRLPLSTLLGLDDQPGEISGLSSVPGRVAVAIARRRVGARTTVLLHNSRGELEYLLDLGPPPEATSNRRRRQIVEITADTGLLELLDPADHGAGRGEVLRSAQRALAAALEDPEAHPAVSLADRDRRFPGAALARWIYARDQTCPFAACTRRAHDNDIDHTVARHDHGETVASNLSPPCRAHHSRKHRTWQLHQPRPGRFVITDPTGTAHHTASRVVDPLPQPCPPTEEEPHRVAPEELLPVPREPTDPWRPRRTRDGRITGEARDTAAHLVARARRLRGDPPDRYDDDPDF